MKNNKKIGIFVLITLLSLSNCVLADDNIDYTLNNDASVEKIKANKDTISKAQAAMNEKDYQTAINLLSGYINEKSKKYEVYKMRGDAYYALRRYNLAQKDYQSAIDLKSSGDKLMTNTKYISAIVLGADKNEQLQNTELGDLYGALMYAQKAQNDPAYTASYEQAVKYNSHIYLPQPNKNLINRINCPQKYGKIINPQGIDAKIYGAINDIESNNFNEAIYKLHSVISEYPNYYLGHYLMGVALSELEKDEDAIKSFNRAISLNPYDFESYASLGRIYYSKAETTFSNDYAKQSVNYFKKAINLNKNCPTYYFYIGMNELQTGNTNAAIYNFNQALKINSSDYNSLYYKLIAQYMEGNYQDVAEGATKLIYRHVSNYNSVLYLRALAYTKLNDTERALQDLNSIENNIEDIFNTDIKQTSAREKSLESYTHYLKSEIQHLKGAGAASDNSVAYSNPIINRLVNAKKAIQPYEKSLEGETISLSDYKKYNNFYSTALPKLLESGAIITYEDIDNQYDYIRTTFDDIGVSFVYLNPNYKITTIKDYPYKKYASKLSQADREIISKELPSDTRDIELKQNSEALRKSTPNTELLVQSGQQSIAQLLASNDLAKAQKIEHPQSASQLKQISTAPEQAVNQQNFKSETPDAEKIDVSKNIASGDIYERKTPLVDKNNNQKVKSLLNEENTINNELPVLRPQDKSVETSPDGAVKISVKNPLPSENAEAGLKVEAKEIKQTDDVVIKYQNVKPVTSIVAQTTQTGSAITSEATKAVSSANNQIAEVKEDIKSNVKQEKLALKQKIKEEKEAAKRAQQEAKEQLKQEKLAAEQLEKQKKAELKAQLREQKQAAQQIEKEQKEQLIAQLNAQKQIAKQLEEEQKEQLLAQKKAATQIKEKHANINTKDYGIAQTKNQVSIDNIEDVVELKTDSSITKMTPDSDLFTKKTIFTKPQTTAEITPPVVLPEEPAAQVNKQAQNVNTNITEKIANNNATVQEQTPEIQIPELKVTDNTNNTKKEINLKENSTETINAELNGNVTKAELDQSYVKEKLSEIIDKALPATEEEKPVNSVKNATESSVKETLKDAKEIKAKRLQIKRDKQLAKQQQKALKKKAKEELKLQKEQGKTLISKHKTEIKEQQQTKEALLKQQKLKVKQDEKIQKVFSKEQKKLEENKAKEISTLQNKVAKEQAKAVQANDETKIQRLKARLASERGNRVLSREEKEALNAKYKADKAAAKERYKARQAAKKAALKAQKEKADSTSKKTFFSKLKFWEK